MQFYDIWCQLWWWLILESFLAPGVATRWRDLHLKKKTHYILGTHNVQKLKPTFIFVWKCSTTWHLPKSFTVTIVTHSDTMSYLAKCGAGKQKHVWCLVVRRSWLRWCIIIYSTRTQHRRREMCLIKRIPLKSVMECWVWICGQWTWGELRTASVMFDHHGGRRHSQNYRREESFGVEIQSQKVTPTAEREKRPSDNL